MRHRQCSTLMGLLAALLAVLVVAPAAPAATITSAGPLQSIDISDDLNCQVTRSDERSPSFFGALPGACATLVAAGGTLYRPASIPAGDRAAPFTPYTKVSQAGPTGTGTAADPFKIVTVVGLGASGLRITQTDSYVQGDEAYRTDVTVSNSGPGPAGAIVYRAGDCFLQGSDVGFGRVDGEAVSCVGIEPGSEPPRPGARIEQFFPISAGSSYLHGGFSSVWAAAGSQGPFPNMCNLCDQVQDNGAGISWSVTVPAGGSVTRSSLITFSPLGRQPLVTTKAADGPTSPPGSNNGYTITLENPNAGQGATIDSITDTLPAGFNYRPGTTQEPGGGTDNPSISDRVLTFSGPYTVPPGGTATLRFGVTVASTPGDYFNNAGGESRLFTVAPTGDTAKVVVTAPDPPPPDSDGDGVPDPRDACPAVPANTPDGCPGPPPPGDGDGDGVPDSRDACPAAPAANTLDGCPGRPPGGDGDGDGVPDFRDGCPTVPANTLDGCPLPPPVLGASFNVQPLRGEVFVSLPPAASTAARLIRGPLASAVVPGLKGRSFIPLSEARQVPIGSLLDTRQGTVQISSARDAAGQLQSGDFLGGVFQVLQSRRRSARGLTELRLKGASFASCKKPARGKRRSGERRGGRRRGGRRRARRSSAPIAVASRRIRRVRSNTNGRFRTRGRDSSATVRGTEWTTTDRCDGTLTKVTRGTVAVRDFRRKKTIVVKAGKSYLAKARR